VREGLASSWALRLEQPHRLVSLLDRFESPTFESRVSYLAHGNGRSYGDSCLNVGQGLLLTRGLDRFMRFDAERGVIRCEAGVLLDSILEVIVPKGWFLPVTPGTSFVTVGGAIANDVHGKNHHVAGTFGRHVRELELLRSDGSVRVCSRQVEPELFAATIGGLGLTGLIRWAEFDLKKIPGEFVDGEAIKFETLEQFAALSAESDGPFEYTVSWIDCLSKGGRGVFSRGNHSAQPGGVRRARALAVPVTPPVSLVNSWSVRAMNTALYRKQWRGRIAQRWHYRSFFYPLDGIHGWNRLYGPRGFFQFQCALPPESALHALPEMLGAIRAAKQGSFLAVLKQFGISESPGLLSFPRAGMTLAVDFPNRGPETLRLLESLQRITVEARGALYPAKDATMSASAFRSSFPALERFSASIDPNFSSSFWRRVTA
jgi:FAD/FMN-containing dehydrogenase